MDSVGLKKKVRIWEVKEVLERMGKEGGAGRTWSEHTTFLKEFILLKMLPQCLLSEGRGPPHQKYQIYHSGNHVIVMTTFKEPTQSLFCKALMLMPIIQAWVGLRNRPLPDCIPTYSQQRTPTDNVLWFHCYRETSSIFLPYISPDSLGFNQFSEQHADPSRVILL